MTTYNTYKIFNLDEFEATGLVSRTIQAVLSGIGLKEILITKGNLFGILYDGVFLCLNVNEKNYLEFDGHSIFIDENNDVHLGIAVPET